MFEVLAGEFFSLQKLWAGGDRMDNPLRGMIRKQVKVFTADEDVILEGQVNEFLSQIGADSVLDVKYASGMPEAGIILHTALIIYETIL